jgi:hypothetical protein
MAIEQRPGWLRHGLFALRRYERARAGVLIRHQSTRSDADRRIAQGLLLLTVNAARVAASQRECAEWRELVWRLEQATKGRTFQDQNANPHAWDALIAADDQLRALNRRVQQATLEVARAQMEIDRLLAAGETARAMESAREVNQSRADVDAADRDMRRYVSRLDIDQNTAVALASVPPARSEHVRAALQAGEVFVGYLWAAGDLLRTVVTHDAGCSVEALRVTATGPGGLFEWAGLQARRAQRRLLRLEDDEAADGSTGEDAAVVGELLPGLPDGTHTLFLSPAGPLLGVSWHDLPLPGGSARLGDRLAIGIVPSAGVLTQLRGRPGQAAEAPYLGVACDPGGERALPGADDLVRRLAREHFGKSGPDECLTTTDCDRLFELRRRVSVLHLACHAGRGGLLLSGDGRWTTPLDLARVGVRADVLLLTACNTGSFATDENNEFLGVVRQLMIVTEARAAVVSAVPVSTGAALLLADLLLCALTGSVPAGRPWTAIERALPLGRAIAWARARMAEMSVDEVRGFIGTAGVSPLIHESWWRPWFVVGDPSVKIERKMVHGDPARGSHD